MRAFLLQQMVEGMAARYPKQEAVRCGGAQWRFEELERVSRHWALELRARGCAEGARVGVWAPKSFSAVAALLAVLRAGGVYVPLDPGAPSARIERLASDCGLQFLWADASRIEMARRWPQPPPVAVLEEATGVQGTAEALPPPRRTSSDLAYILYTSGSTGVPKGVMLTHAHALNFIEWAAEEIGLGPGDRVASHAPFHFDLSIFDLWASLSRGATVCLLDPVTVRFPSAVADWIEAERITVWYSVPSALVAMQACAARLCASGLRALVFAGEVFPMASLRAWRAALPNVPLHNWYGPTETNVCTHYPLLPGEPVPDPLPIGHACPDFELALRDESGAPTPEGAAGLLWVRGPGILAGYWGDGARFEQVSEVRATADGILARWYNTGDWAHWSASGELVYEGRRDHVVKCRGYRVALREVEQALETCPGVQQAAVVPIPDALQTRALHAYVCTLNSTHAEAELRQHLASLLPAYMVPSRIAVVAWLPLTATGKIDRQRLAALEATVAAGGTSQ
ncbi:MAG TPA: amino acid adenylation domain-containing protein [Terriglobales bacterium]|nr:amino acid adenylation domain-containing protein [Terriglobales bacterium]